MSRSLFTADADSEDEVAGRAREALLYVLLEHQSSSDPWMPLRMLVYITRIWQRCADDEPKQRIPPVIPVVLHHSQGEWTAPRTLGELIDADESLQSALGSLLPGLRFHLVDLTRHDDQTLRSWLATDLGKLVALCLKHVAYDPVVTDRIRDWLDLLGRVVRAPGGVAALDAVTRYMLEVSELTVDSLRLVLEYGLSQNEVDVVMTGAEKLREEGRLQGWAQGKAEGKVEVVLKLLALRFGTLPALTETRIRAASVEQLDRWAERVLTAASLDDVLR